MGYEVKISKKALRELKKMDRFQSKIIMDWIEKNLVGTDNPRRNGKGLVGDRSGYWRYRVGDYRIIADLQEDVVTIMILKVGHRKEIYKQ